MATFKLRNGESLNFAVSSKDIIKFLDSSMTMENIQRYSENKVSIQSSKSSQEKIVDQEYDNYDFIIPYSSKRKLQYDDIKNFNVYLLGIARNEIYARHGYIFTSPEYKNYFTAKAWYKSNANFNENELTDIEKYNGSFILEREQQLKGK